MGTLRLYFLGPPKLSIDGEEIRLSRRKGMALLAYVAVTGEAQRRDTLATLLWPESNQTKARRALRRELSSLRKAISGAWIMADREYVDLQWDAGVWLDARHFMQYVSGAASHDADIEKLEAGVALYRDDFLSGFTLPDAPGFDEWQFFETDIYRQKLFTTLDLLVAYYRQQGEVDNAMTHARRRLSLDLLYEPVHRTLMALYVEAGQRSAALRQYDECVRILRMELGIGPAEETTALYEEIRTRHFPQVEVETVAMPSLAVTLSQDISHSLPSQVTPFIGREREVEEVLNLLAAPACRLITITGAGGMGKTRLGLAVAEASRPHFSDGVWFVALASVDGVEEVPTTIAATLPVPVGNADVRSSLFGFLRQKQLLLLLDNIDHLLESADFLSALLQQAPQVKLLVTSRERLNLLEESVYPLGGLATPADDVVGGDMSASVTLFEQAAQRVRPDFSIQAELADVAAICSTVEGMPLALELAAGWVRGMSCRGIAVEIQRGGDFLSTTLRNVPARHRSMRALFERSWLLLSVEERAALQRLAVFRDGFDRRAALAIADASPQMLVSLIDRSLLWRQADGRFDMHGLLRQFATEKLAAHAEEEALSRRRHAYHFAERMTEAGWELEPGDEALQLALEKEAANFLAAWRWGVRQQDATVIRRMMRWLLDFFRRRGDYNGSEAAYSSAVRSLRSAPAQAQDAGLIGSLLMRQAKSYVLARMEDAATPAQEAVTLLRSADPPDPLELAQALVKLGMIYSFLGRNPEGADLLAEAVGLFDQVRSRLGVGATLRDWGMLERNWGRMGEAQRRLEESRLALAGQDQKSYMQSTFLLGGMLKQRGHYARAAALLQSTLPFFIEHREEMLAGYVLTNLGDLYTATGDFIEAERCFAGAYAHLEPVGMAYEVTASFCLSPAVLARLRGDADAEARLLEALAISRQSSHGQYIAINLHHLARLRYDQRAYRDALGLLDEALLVSRQIDYRYATALSLTRRGHTLLALREVDAARTALAEALTISKQEEIDRVACDALAAVAQDMARDGETNRAVAVLAFVQACEASEWETKEQARQALVDLAEYLPADEFRVAQTKGREADLSETISEVLVWLTSRGS